MRNLKRYWREHLVHVLVGVLGGTLVFTGSHDGITLAVIYGMAGAIVMGSMALYQTLSFWRKASEGKGDTPGIDWKYTMLGFVAVCIWNLDAVQWGLVLIGL